MKNTLKRFWCGVVTAVGIEVGIDAYRKLKNPVTRVNIKKKFKKIKDAVLSKEEESE